MTEIRELRERLTKIKNQLARMASGATFVADGHVRVTDPVYLLESLSEAASALNSLSSQVEALKAEQEALQFECWQKVHEAEDRAAHAEAARTVAIAEMAQQARDAGAAEARASTAEARVAVLGPLVQQAFRDGIAYANNVTVTTDEQIDVAWQQSRARQALSEIHGDVT